jgi:chemotaxis signal transduction protein
MTAMDGKAANLESKIPGGLQDRHDFDADVALLAERHAQSALSQRRGIRISNFGLLLESPMLYEIVESARISPLPGVTAVSKGLINHRSKVVPVYDLAALTDAPPPVWERKRLLILYSGKDAVAVMLYNLPAQLGQGTAVPVDEIDGLPPVFARHARHACRHEDTCWLALDYESFFTELGRSCLGYS